MNVPCIIYAAKSTEDVRGSIPTQIDDCEAAIETEGGGRFIYGDPQFDEDASAFRGNRGPGLAEAKRLAVEAAAEYETAELWVQHTDRLARGDGLLAEHVGGLYFAMRRARVRLRSVQDDHNVGDAIRAVLIGERNFEDSNRKSQAVKAGKRRQAMAGRRNGGPDPYGYEHRLIRYDEAARRPITKLVVVPSEAAVVRWMADEYRSGLSQGAIARNANALGHRTKQGTRWRQSQVGALLRNHLYCGHVAYCGEFFPGEHEPILSGEEFEELAALRRTRSRRGNGAGRRTLGPHLLVGGLLRCTCGAALVPRTQRKRHGLWAAYLCDGRKSGSTDCRQAAISQAVIDDAVFNYFCEVGLDVERMIEEAAERASRKANHLRQQIAAAERGLSGIEAAIDRIDRVYADGELPRHRYARHVGRLEAERASAIAALDQLRSAEQELSDELIHGEMEDRTLAALARLRATIAGTLNQRDDLNAARASVRVIFDHFRLHRYDDPEMPEILDGSFDLGKYYVEPIIRPEAVIQQLVPGAAKEEGGFVEQPQILRRVAPALSAGEQPADSRRSTSVHSSFATSGSVRTGATTCYHQGALTGANGRQKCPATHEKTSARDVERVKSCKWG